MSRPVLLLTIGAPPLPTVTPIQPVTTTTSIDTWTAPAVAAPTGLIVEPVIDGARIKWTRSATSGADTTILEIAPDNGGFAGSWTVEARTTEEAWSLNLPNGARWIRVSAELNGRTSSTSMAVLATPKTVGGAVNENLLANSSFRTSLANWSLAQGAGWLLERDAVTLSDRVPGTHNMCLRHTGSPSGVAIATSALVAADAGARYIASGSLAQYNAAAKVRLSFYDAAQALLSFSDSTITGGIGGTSAANYNRGWADDVAPAGTAFASLSLVVVASGGSAPKGWLVQPMLEHASAQQAGPSAWRVGAAEGVSGWNVRVEAGTPPRVSGIELANDGTQAAFDVLADQFSVSDPDGGDALTWQGGVISIDKGAKALKLGPGFGADPAGKRLLLAFGDGGSAATRTRANSRIFIAEDGVKLGSVEINGGAGWESGGQITVDAAAGTPATATISRAAGGLAIGDDKINYSAATASVSGTGGTTVTYYLYFDDPGRLGGALPLHASTDPKVTYAYSNYVLAGSVAVQFPTSGTTTGGGYTPGGSGDLPCVSVDALVIERDLGRMRAGDVRVGHWILGEDDSWEEVIYSQRKLTTLVRLHFSGGGTLTCSTSAPIATAAGDVLAPDLLQHLVRCRGLPRVCIRVEEIGSGWVQHIDRRNTHFYASDDGEAWALHHNMKYMP